MGNVAYKELIDYNMKPYFGDISRKEFLVLMFSLLSDQSVSEDEILKQLDELSANGFRVIALAYDEKEGLSLIVNLKSKNFKDLLATYTDTKDIPTSVLNSAQMSANILMWKDLMDIDITSFTPFEGEIDLKEFIVGVYSISIQETGIPGFEVLTAGNKTELYVPAR